MPLLGSRTLIRELAHDMNLKITVPYAAWFHKHQVLMHCNIASLYLFCLHLCWSQFADVFCLYFGIGGWLGDWVWQFVNFCHSKGCCTHGTLCTAIKSIASIQCICAWPEIAKHNTAFNWWLRRFYLSFTMWSQISNCFMIQKISLKGIKIELVVQW